MGGWGFATHGFQSVRDNLKQLKRNSRFKKGRSFLNSETTSYKRNLEGLKIRKLFKEELQDYREKTQERASRERFKLNSVIVVCALVLLIPLGWFVTTMIQHDVATQPKKRVLSEKERYELYQESMTIGDKWLKKRDYPTAAYYYKYALTLYPKDSLATFQLFTAYELNCEVHDENCKESVDLMNDFMN